MFFIFSVADRSLRSKSGRSPEDLLARASDEEDVPITNADLEGLSLGSPPERMDTSIEAILATSDITVEAEPRKPEGFKIPKLPVTALSSSASVSASVTTATTVPVPKTAKQIRNEAIARRLTGEKPRWYFSDGSWTEDEAEIKRLQEAYVNSREANKRHRSPSRSSRTSSRTESTSRSRTHSTPHRGRKESRRHSPHRQRTLERTSSAAATTTGPCNLCLRDASSVCKGCRSPIVIKEKIVHHPIYIYAQSQGLWFHPVDGGAPYFVSHDNFRRHNIAKSTDSNDPASMNAVISREEAAKLECEFPTPSSN